MRHLSLAALALALTATGVFARPPSTEVKWSHSWKEAKEEAELRNVPILVVFHKDGCDGSAQMDKVYASKDLVTASKKWVLVICNKDSGHGTKKEGTDDVCALYPGLKCAEHVALWKEMSAIFNPSEEIGTPTALMVDVIGDEKGRQAGVITLKTITDGMTAVAKKVGDGLGLDDFEFAREQMQEGDKAARALNVPEALKSYNAVLAKIQKTPGAKNTLRWAQGGLDKLNALGKVRLDRAMEMVAAKDYENAKNDLKEVIAGYKGLPVAKEAQKACDDVVAKEKQDAKDGVSGNGAKKPR